MPASLALDAFEAAAPGALPIAGSVALVGTYQVGELIRAVEGEADPDTWALKFITLLCISALGWLGKKLYESPRASEVDALRKDLRSAEARIADLSRARDDERDRRYAAERERDMANIRSEMRGAP